MKRRARGAIDDRSVHRVPRRIRGLVEAFHDEKDQHHEDDGSRSPGSNQDAEAFHAKSAVRFPVRVRIVTSFLRAE